MVDEKEIQLAREIFAQYWLHVRHQELQRLTFTSIYAAIVAGTLAYLAAIEMPFPFSILPMIFLMILSLLGILVVIAWRIPFLEYMLKARKILQKYGFKEFNPYEGIKAKKPMTVYRAFLRFYELTFSLMCALIVCSFVNNLMFSMCAFILSIIILEILTYHLTKMYEKPFRQEIPPYV